MRTGGFRRRPPYEAAVSDPKSSREERGETVPPRTGRRPGARRKPLAAALSLSEARYPIESLDRRYQDNERLRA
jgi:hypothetical protein